MASTFMSLSCLVCLVFSISNSQGSASESTDYGVDVSYPMHRYIQDRGSIFSKRYETSLAGCYKAYSKAACDSTENQRMTMNLAQPRMQHNYTELGFKKTRLPDDIFREILQFYDDNKKNEKLEHWPPGNTFVNHWDSPSYMISFEDRVSFDS